MSNSARRRLDNLDQLVADFQVPRDEDLGYQIAYKLWESLDTPMSLSCYLLLKYKEYEQLVGRKCRPQDYSDVSSFDDDYQAVSFLKKYPDFPGMAEKAELKAVETFYKAEDICADANQRLRAFRRSQNTSFQVRSVIYRAAEICLEVLGPYVNTDLWFSSCRFGPGVSDTCRGLGTSYNKLDAPLSVTRAFHEMGLQLVAGSPSWSRTVHRTGLGEVTLESGRKATTFETPPEIGLKDLRTTIGNTVTFVPKTALTDRAIAIEPHINIFAQLGLGSMIRGKLKKHGVDLDHQAEHHANLALSASLAGDLATIDLSMASDTISYEVVKELIPPKWFHALDLTRSRSGVIKGTVHHYEKFSSMGNGYTFELETLIFWSLARACCDYESVGLYDERGLICSCFGDDIIVPTKVEPLLKEVITFCGFSYNVDKTYVKSAFKESCGHDYYVGTNVRPIFQKESITDVNAVIGVANRIRLKAHSRNRYFGCDLRFRRVWLDTLAVIPKTLRQSLLGPAAVEANYYSGKTRLVGGDTSIIENLDYASSSPFVLFDRETAGYTYGRLSCVKRALSPSSAYALIASALYENRNERTRSMSSKPRDKLLEALGLRIAASEGQTSRAGGFTTQFVLDVESQPCFSQTVGHVELWPNLGPWI